MWGLLSRNAQVSVIVGAGILTAWLIDLVNTWWYGAPAGILTWISIATLLVGTGLAWIASALWRPVWAWLPWIERWTFPDLNGNWTGTIVSTSSAEPKAHKLQPRPVEITIRQGLFSTTVKLRTQKAESHSTRCMLEAHHESGIFRLWYSYDYRPLTEHSSRSARYEGVAWLQIDIDKDPDRLTGIYYTDRRTRGELDVRRNGDADCEPPANPGRVRTRTIGAKSPRKTPRKARATASTVRAP
jgi:hypothetical protein